MTEVSTTEDTAMAMELRSVRKVEWGVIIALTINIMTAAFFTGVYFNTITEQERRITELEKDRTTNQTTLTAQNLSLTRIEGDVRYLRERAEEDRRVLYQRRGL